MTILKNIDDIKEIESVSFKCSEKYVPIKTTDFLSELGSFKMVNGYKPGFKSSMHIVELKDQEDDDISVVIMNSFDRSSSFRIYFKYQSLVFGKIKQVHKGHPAEEINESVNNLGVWYNNASRSIEAMKNMDLTRDEKEDIVKVAFKERGVSYRLVSNVDYSKDNALDFVLYILNGLEQGEFYMTSRNKIKYLKPVNRPNIMINIGAKIWSKLTKISPELFI